jgi:hypothetical protein
VHDDCVMALALAVRLHAQPERRRHQETILGAAARCTEAGRKASGQIFWYFTVGSSTAALVLTQAASRHAASSSGRLGDIGFLIGRPGLRHLCYQWVAFTVRDGVPGLPDLCYHPSAPAVHSPRWRASHTMSPRLSRGRKATGPRLLRDAVSRSPDATSDPTTAELPKGCSARVLFGPLLFIRAE